MIALGVARAGRLQLVLFAGDPFWRGGHRGRRQDLQQHAARRLHDRHLRGHEPRN